MFLISLLFQNSQKSETDTSTEHKDVADEYISYKRDSFFMVKSCPSENTKFMDKRKAEKKISSEKGKRLNIKRSLSKTMSSILLAMRKIF